MAIFRTSCRLSTATVVSGRAGMREHCKKHDVVPTADLAGLPHRRPDTMPDRNEIREIIARQLYK